ncbi:hypothetical protein CRP01_27925 [Flavilitoribacter nigricans DSM 23189 = NBRC 102662]|uniref:Uncharacterized protein n=1 Tax=Flavilitoribacter nigricans (strain ATCC 23147 / DSM 23189 / NBRC 102662 / NCIMB 1420 / SS-2) TaxID=1122177 RepID=A0A2D0N4C2_FLAN2|nr:hypothetical protein CRP01_27925 [Flavilitoribacter nigricans DSM 23189 = NBRC 102662]
MKGHRPGFGRWTHPIGASTGIVLQQYPESEVPIGVLCFLPIDQKTECGAAQLGIPEKNVSFEDLCPEMVLSVSGKQEMPVLINKDFNALHTERDVQF